MQCRKCHYELWNTPSRQCPECGEPFTPSDYRFAPNSVKFICPQCRQIYYGTDVNGHLDPPAFDCVSCGQSVTMDQMLLEPADGRGSASLPTAWNPWIDARGRNILMRWLISVGYSLVMPNRLIDGTPVGSRVASAWWFALVTLAIYAAGTALPLLLIGAVSMLFGNADPGLLLFSGVAWLLPVVVPILFTLIWGLTAHALLRVTGETLAGIGRTYQCLFYGAGAMVILVIPCIGPYFSFLGCVWWTVSSTIMLSLGQRVHGGRAALATLTLPVVIFVSIIALYVLFTVGMLYGVQSSATYGPTPPANPTPPLVYPATPPAPAPLTPGTP